MSLSRAGLSGSGAAGPAEPSGLAMAADRRGHGPPDLL